MFLHLDLEGWILENLVDQAGVKKVYVICMARAKLDHRA